PASCGPPASAAPPPAAADGRGKRRAEGGLDLRLAPAPVLAPAARPALAGTAPRPVLRGAARVTLATGFGSRPALHRQRDALALDIDLQDRHLDDLAHLDRLARVLHEPVRQLRDMHEAILVDADVHEGAEVRHVRHHALQPHAGPQVGDPLDAFREARADELATGIATRLLELGQDVAHRRLAEAIVGELRRIQSAQQLAPADDLGHRAPDAREDALDHRIGLRMNRRRVERILPVGYAQEPGRELEGTRPEMRDLE